MQDCTQKHHLPMSNHSVSKPGSNHSASKRGHYCQTRLVPKAPFVPYESRDTTGIPRSTIHPYQAIPHQIQDATGKQDWTQKHSVSKPRHHWQTGLVPKTAFTYVKAFRIMAGTPLGYRTGPKSTIFICQTIPCQSWDTTGIPDWSEKHHFPTVYLC